MMWSVVTISLPCTHSIIPRCTKIAQMEAKIRRAPQETFGLVAASLHEASIEHTLVILIFPIVTNPYTFPHETTCPILALGRRRSTSRSLRRLSNTNRFLFSCKSGVGEFFNEHAQWNGLWNYSNWISNTIKCYLWGCVIWMQSNSMIIAWGCAWCWICWWFWITFWCQKNPAIQSQYVCI